MTTPMRPVPADVDRWLGRRRWLRWADALLAWLLLAALALLLLGPERSDLAAGLALALVIAGVWLQPLRVRWRPITGWVGLRMSRDLRPGARAWYLGAHEATLVVVTARRGVRLVIARPGLAQDEGMSVRRTRVFVLAADTP
jgi:hypothetical protein